MVMAPVPVVLLFILVQFVVVAVWLVTFTPIVPVNDVLVAVPGVVVAVIFIVNSHASGAT
jgi:hypothetical protein